MQQLIRVLHIRAVNFKRNKIRLDRFPPFTYVIIVTKFNCKNSRFTNKELVTILEEKRRRRFKVDALNGVYPLIGFVYSMKTNAYAHKFHIDRKGYFEKMCKKIVSASILQKLWYSTIKSITFYKHTFGLFFSFFSSHLFDRNYQWR